MKDAGLDNEGFVQRSFRFGMACTVVENQGNVIGWAGGSLCGCSTRVLAGSREVDQHRVSIARIYILLIYFYCDFHVVISVSVCITLSVVIVVP